MQIKSKAIVINKKSSYFNHIIYFLFLRLVKFTNSSQFREIKFYLISDKLISTFD